MNTPTPTINLNDLIRLARSAGSAIMDVYGGDHHVEFKDDHSPLTLADKKSNAVITEGLKRLYPSIPILSEEGKHLPYAERRQWACCWMVDPLDGTKEFIKRNGEFTVNIALIEGGRPVIGVIYAPVKDLLYVAGKGRGAYKITDAQQLTDDDTTALVSTKAYHLPLTAPREKFTVIGSRSHMSQETMDYIASLEEQRGKAEVIAAGSSLKFCRVAEGAADVYPRFAPTMEWDTAAGHIIAEEAGATVTQAGSDEPLVYNKKDLLNPWFVVSRS